MWLLWCFLFFFIKDLTREDLKGAQPLILIGIILLITGLFLRIFFGTYYKIENGFLYHRSGPFSGKTKIPAIRKIEYHSGWYVPVLYRPATDTVGFIIKYNQSDDIYFSSRQREAFAKKLLKINPEIEVSV